MKDRTNGGSPLSGSAERIGDQQSQPSTAPGKENSHAYHACVPLKFTLPPPRELFRPERPVKEIVIPDYYDRIPKDENGAVPFDPELWEKCQDPNEYASRVLGEAQRIEREKARWSCDCFAGNRRSHDH